MTIKMVHGGRRLTVVLVSLALLALLIWWFVAQNGGELGGRSLTRRRDQAFYLQPGQESAAAKAFQRTLPDAAALKAAVGVSVALPTKPAAPASLYEVYKPDPSKGFSVTYGQKGELVASKIQGDNPPYRVEQLDPGIQKAHMNVTVNGHDGIAREAVINESYAGTWKAGAMVTWAQDGYDYVIYGDKDGELKVKDLLVIAESVR